MNHIVRLQTDLADANAIGAATADAIQAFRVHLASGKFSGVDPDGSRRDWIAVSEVRAWLDLIAAAGS